MKYQEPLAFNRQLLEDAFDSDDEGLICEALLSMAFHEPDWEWAQDKCLDELESNRPRVRAIAATCLGHIARIHRVLDKEKVIFALKRHLVDEGVAGQAEDALDDIDVFVD